MHSSSCVRVAALAAVLLAALPARAEGGPDGGLAVVVGAATIVTGMAVGGTLLAATGTSASGNEAGWLVMQGGFALSPLTSHAVVDEWGRGAFFAAFPAAAFAGTVPVFLQDPAAVGSGSLWEQRFLWGFYCGGLATGVAGVVDAALAPGRASRAQAPQAAASGFPLLRVLPMASPGGGGLLVAGAL